MMAKEEVDMANIVKYCNDNGVSYKARLSELGVPEWRFFESNRHYAKEPASSSSPSGEFRQLTAGGDFVPMPAFAAKTGRLKPEYVEIDTKETRTLERATARVFINSTVRHKVILKSDIEDKQPEDRKIPIADLPPGRLKS